MTKAQYIMSKIAGTKETALAYVERMRLNKMKQAIKTPEQYAQVVQQEIKTKALADHAIQTMKNNVTTR